MLYPLNEAVRSGGDLRNAGGSDMYVKDIGKNPFISKAFQ